MLIGHVTQVAASVAAVLVEYVPAKQSVHTALPVLILYLPATQAVHEPPSGPVNPALQVQAARAVLGLGELELLGHARHVPSAVACVLVEYFPAPQSVHAALPVLVLYLPATQAVHEPAGPVNPSLQIVCAGHVTLQEEVIPEPKTDSSLVSCTIMYPVSEVYGPVKLVLDRASCSLQLSGDVQRKTVT